MMSFLLVTRSRPLWCVGKSPSHRGSQLVNFPIAHPDHPHKVGCEGSVQCYSLSGSGECLCVLPRWFPCVAHCGEAYWSENLPPELSPDVPLPSRDG